MKAPIVTLSLTCLLNTAAVYAQDGRPRAADRPDTPAAAAPATDAKVFPADTVLPAPTAPDQIPAATIALPNDPIEPWLLKKEDGPFMVMAKTFRGPEAERYALALAMELRRDFGLPAYILRTKDFPQKSNMRGVPPMAPPYINRSNLTEPERVRSYDEAAVLVGNEKTLAASEALLHRVKKIKPKCLNGMPSILPWRVDHPLASATRTTNPYVPAQNLFPGRGTRDNLVVQMNSGPQSINHCPGRYTLQVAEFGGRAVFNAKESDPKFGDGWLKKSPLATAADDAERLADTLAKDPEIQRTGCQPYVFHDRTSSKVMIGSFNAPNEPSAAQLRETLLKRAGVLSATKNSPVIAPAVALTDLEDPQRPIKQR